MGQGLFVCGARFIPTQVQLMPKPLLDKYDQRSNLLAKINFPADAKDTTWPNSTAISECPEAGPWAYTAAPAHLHLAPPTHINPVRPFELTCGKAHKDSESCPGTTSAAHFPLGNLPQIADLKVPSWEQRDSAMAKGIEKSSV